MIIECDRCYARYKYDEARFEGKGSKKVRCTKCLSVFEIFNTAASQPAALSSPGPEDTVSRLPREGKERRDSIATRKIPSVGARRSPSELTLPASAKLSLAVIAGPEAGRIYPIEKPRVVIGRHDADINLEDPEISRQHAAIEVSGEKVTLVDLGSTNGTFLAEAPVQSAPIENQDEFTVGGSTLILIITPRDLP